MEKPEFNFGDLVHVDGYHPQLFIVDGYREENYFYPDEQWTDIVYELHCAHSGEWIEADEEELTLVASAEDAEAYLSVHPAPMRTIGPLDTGAILSFMFGGDVMKPNQPKKPSAREISSQLAKERKAARKEREDTIDNLLDIAGWNRKMLEKTNDDSYGDRLFAAEAELKKLVENE